MAARFLLAAAFLHSEAAAFGTIEPCAAPPPPKGNWPGHKGLTALIQVDVQKCFTNGPPVGVDNDFAYCNSPATGGNDECSRLGSLGVPSGATIVPAINDLRHSCLFDGVFRSQDYHPEHHISFSSRHFGKLGGAFDGSGFFYDGGPIPYVGYTIDLHCTIDPERDILEAQCCLVDVDQPHCTINGTNVCTRDTDPTNAACACAPTDSGGEGECTRMAQGMWTDHCLQNGDSGWATGLEVADTDMIVQKGITPNMDAYSVFKDNAKLHDTSLHKLLQTEGFGVLVFTGIATDFCVFWSAMDAIDLGYEVFVVTDASAPIEFPNDDGTTSLDTAMTEMEAKGVQFITSDELLEVQCPERRSLAETRKQWHNRNNMGVNDERRRLVQKYGKTIKLW